MMVGLKAQNSSSINTNDHGGKAMKRKRMIYLMMFVTPGLLTAQVNFQATQTNNINSSALGLGCNASGAGSLASGFNCASTGIAAHAFGMNANAPGLYSLSAGYSAQSTGSYSLAIGTYVKSSAIRSLTLGSGYASSYLENNVSNSLMIGFNSDQPTLFVGNSSGPGTAGRVGIATTSPAARLDINAGTINGLLVQTSQGGSGGYAIRCSASNPGTEAISVMLNGDTTLRLFADGSMRMDNTLVAKEVKVRLNVWKDDVFSEKESLMSLDSLERYLASSKHLPGILPEQEALAAPVDLGILSVALLGKIEELTLYLIELNGKFSKLEKDFQQIRNANLKNPSP